MHMTERVSGLAEVRGSGTIELFDDRGRKEYEQPFENDVVTMGLWHQRWMQRFDLSRGMPSAAWRTGNPRVLDPFMGVLLTDSTLPEGHALEGMPLGMMVGWADKSTYVGSDVYRGSPNAAECSASETTVKWVFDWPTHAALGSTGSVLWAPVRNFAALLSRSGPAVPRLRVSGDEGNTSGSIRSSLSVYIFHQSGSGSNSASGICQLPDGSFLLSCNPGSQFGLITVPADYTAWTASTSRLMFGPLLSNIGYTSGSSWCAADATNVWVSGGNKICRFPQSSLGSLDATEVVVPTDPSWTSLRDMSHDGTYLWVCEGATNKVLRIHPTTGVLERQWSCPNSAVGEHPVAIAYDPNLGRVWVGTAHSTGPGRLYLCDLDGTPLAQWSMGDYQWTSSTDLTTSYVVDMPVTATSWNWGLCVTADGKLLSTWGDSRFFEIDPVSAGTRALLASPIVKSSFQSMKLTYSFTFS